MPKIPETDDFVVDLRKKESPVKLNSNPSPVVKTSESNLTQASNNNYWSFIKYNNAFLVVLVIGIMLFSSLAFASEEVRENTIGAKQVYAEGVDNTLLLETDLTAFNMDFTITGIIEDDESYLITYSYIDLAITNNHESETNDYKSGAWQMQEKQGGRKISKPFRRDLGLYLAEQLSQEAKARIKELKKIKKQELTKGETKIVQVTKYSGLIGKVLDISANTFPNYEPIKKIELKTPTVAENVSRRANSAPDNMTDVYNEWVEENPEKVEELDNQELSDESAQVLSDRQAGFDGADKDITDIEEIIDNQDITEEEVLENTTDIEENIDIKDIAEEEVIEEIQVEEATENTEESVIEEPIVDPPLPDGYSEAGEVVDEPIVEIDE